MRRTSLLTLLFLFSTLRMLAVNDFWMGSRYDIKLSFGAGKRGEEKAAVPRSIHAPIFPEGYIAAGVGGAITLEYSVETDGAVSEVRVIRSTQPDLPAVIIKDVAQWKFSPAIELRSGKPIRSRMRCLIEFVIEEDAAPNGLDPSAYAKRTFGYLNQSLDTVLCPSLFGFCVFSGCRSRL